MERTSTPPHALGLPIEQLFQDITRVADSINEFREKISTTITNHLARCQHELGSLRKVHQNRWRFESESTNDDPFQMRDTLNKFIIACNTLTYLSSPFSEFGSNKLDGCISFPPKKNWRKKQLKTLEEEFFSHERSLSLALSNAVYTTVLQMQRSQTAYEASLGQILRKAERRHHIFEGLDAPIRLIESVKLENFRSEEMDWELCLRRYFDHIEEWSVQTAEAKPEAKRSSSRSSSFSSAMSPNTNSSHSSNSDTLRGESGSSGDVETAIYTRPVRRNSLSQRLRPQGPPIRMLPPSVQTSVNVQASSTAVVLYSTNNERSIAPTPRPVRRASIARDFHWEYVGSSSTWDMLAPLAARCPELRDAQADIFTQTQGMSSTEARAYAQGRLAVLPPEVTDSVQTVLGTMTQPSSDLAMARGRPKNKSKALRLTNASPESSPEKKRVQPKRAVSMDELKARLAPPPDRPLRTKANRNTLDAAPLSSARKPRPKPKPSSHRGSHKNAARSAFVALKELRPMTAISEKSTMTKRAPSLDKPPSRSFMQPFSPRRSNLSLIEPLEESPKTTSSIGSQGSSSAPTIRAVSKSSNGDDKITEEEDVAIVVDLTTTTTTTITAASVTTASVSSFNSFPPNTEKPLPPNPKKSLPGRGLLKKLRAAASRLDLTTSATPAVLTAGQNRSSPYLPVSQSREPLRQMSVEMLKRRDSKMTLVSVSEDMEVPFDMWLRALPFIEGRSAAAPTRAA